jgi:hypothetical protein
MSPEKPKDEKSVKPAVVEKAVVPTVETPRQAADADATAAYNKVVERAAEALSKLARTSLALYNEIGKEVKKIRDNPEKYGGRLVDQFCDDLKKLSGISFEKSSVYKCLEIHTKLTPEQLESLKENNVSIRAVSQLVALNPTEIEKTVQDVASGKIEPSSLFEKIRTDIKKSAGKTGPTKMKTSAAAELFNMVSAKIKGFGEVARQVFREGEVADMRTTQKHLTQAIEAMDGLRVVWDHELDMALEEINKPSVQDALSGKTREAPKAAGKPPAAKPVTAAPAKPTVKPQGPAVGPAKRPVAPKAK